MLIVGAGACAKDLLAMLLLEEKEEAFFFYDDLNEATPEYLYGKYKILKNEKAAVQYFQGQNNKYAIGVGNPKIRFQMSHKFDAMGGKLTSLISSHAHIGPYSQVSERGVIIMHEVILTNEVDIGAGSLINMRCTLGHFCQVGQFCDLAPGVYASTSKIGNFCQIGINAVLKPGINLGQQVTVGAGSVVTKDVGDYQIVAGVPAVCIGENEPIHE